MTRGVSRCWRRRSRSVIRCCSGARPKQLGIEPAVAGDVEAHGLLAIGERVTFRHPLARSAVYRSAVVQERRAAHLALAEATDRDVDPDRRAWHLAAAAAGPDEQVAAELERSAVRAQTRGGLAAAAAFLQRAVALTGDPARRAERALAAAQASLGAGAFDVAHGLLAAAEAGPLDELGRARVDLLRAEVAFAQKRGSEAPLLLLQAARKLETLDVRLARNTYLDAWAAALFAGHLASAGGSLLDVSRAAADCARSGRSAPVRSAAGRPRADLHRGAPRRDAGAPARARCVRGSRGLGGGDAPVGLAGDAGGELPVGLRLRSRDRHARGSARPRLRGARGPRRRGQRVRSDRRVRRRLRDAPRLLTAEVDAVKEATRTRIPPHAAIAVAGIRGREAEATELIDGVITEATAGGQGTAVQYARWASSVLMNGLGRYEEALASAVEASEHTPELHVAGVDAERADRGCHANREHRARGARARATP